MLMFKDAAAQCDFLIVCLQTDPSDTPAEYRGKKKNKPIMSVEERRIILEGIRYVDEIHTYHTEDDLLELMLTLDYDIRILGSDWKGKYATGQEYAKEIYYHTRSHNYSTTELRERIKNAPLA